jgi:hypothetical protein
LEGFVTFRQFKHPSVVNPCIRAFVHLYIPCINFFRKFALTQIDTLYETVL